MIIRILGITLILSSLIIGWIIPEPYTSKSFENGETHMLGLKYMKPCTPFGVDVTCGYDSFLMVFWVMCLFLIIGDISKDKKPSKKCQ